MIHVVTRRNRGLYTRQLLEMHRLRAQIFRDRRGWSALEVREDGGEYDRYDDDDAVYLMSLLPDGSVGCSQRLRMATRSSMLDEVFPHLLGPDTWAVGSDVCEGTRHFLSPAFRKRAEWRPVAELTVAVMETAVAMGASRMIGVIDVFGMQNMIDLNWPLRWLGLPAPYAEGECIAFEVATTPETIANARERLGIEPVRRVRAVDSPEMLEMLKAAERLDPATVRSLARIIEATCQSESEQGEEAALAFIDLVEQLARGEAVLQ